MTHKWLLALALAASPAAAFTFSDGSTMSCMARGELVPEAMAAPDDPTMAGRAGWARRVGERWQIIWNEKRLKELPPELHDFVFFHECAHARVPTEVELEANCAGLVAMRRAGRAGPAVESKLRAMYPSNGYWLNTFRCADAITDPATRKDSGRPDG
jgi:hypothetical protein